jgi:hypothetical protein
MGTQRTTGKAMTRITGAHTLISAMFACFLAVTGLAFLGLTFHPDAARHPALETLARLVGSVFPVVDNVRACATRQAAQTRTLLAVVIPAAHVTMAVVVLSIAGRYRVHDRNVPLVWPGMRQGIEVLGGSLLAVLLYWGTFFSLGRPAPGQPMVASHLCWHLSAAWFLFSLHALLSVGLVCLVLVAVESVSSRLLRRLFTKEL